MVSGIIDGLSVAACAIPKTYIGIAIATSIFAFVESGCHAQRVTIISDFVPDHKTADVVGISILMQGIGSIIQAPAGGTLFTLE